VAADFGSPRFSDQIIVADNSTVGFHFSAYGYAKYKGLVPQTYQLHQVSIFNDGAV
jgi:hypothetical protein